METSARRLAIRLIFNSKKYKHLGKILSYQNHLFAYKNSVQNFLAVLIKQSNIS